MRARAQYNRRVTDAEFVARVRRHTAASVVPLVAQVGARYAERSQWLAPGAATEVETRTDQREITPSERGDARRRRTRYRDGSSLSTVGRRLVRVATGSSE
jgi:hypothetical protein